MGDRERNQSLVKRGIGGGKVLAGCSRLPEPRLEMADFESDVVVPCGTEISKVSIAGLCLSVSKVKDGIDPAAEKPAPAIGSMSLGGNVNSIRTAMTSGRINF
jgi:hypothetical protein